MPSPPNNRHWTESVSNTYVHINCLRWSGEIVEKDGFLVDVELVQVGLRLRLDAGGGDADLDAGGET